VFHTSRSGSATLVPAREMTASQARAAVVRMVPALAALAARAAGSDRPAPLAAKGSGGTLIFLPEEWSGEQSAAYEALQLTLGLSP
jgi:hypothetical protein